MELLRERDAKYLDFIENESKNCDSAYLCKPMATLHVKLSLASI